MQTSALAADTPAELRLTKSNPLAPAFRAISQTELVVHGGIVVHFGDVCAELPANTPIVLPEGRIAGCDYEVVLNPDFTLSAHQHSKAADFGRPVIGGFHFAPGGNASARAGGDREPAINPHSIYDLSFRPACPNPRGMACVEMGGGRKIWVDIYLTGTGHEIGGTSCHGATIATGRTLDRLNYIDAQAIMARHGKQLLGVTEFWAAAYGVTEKAALKERPETTGLQADDDHRFTSRYGLFQATGGVWIWGHDEDPNDRRPSLFGGSWLLGSHAGSRYANLGYWPGHSRGLLGVRGRSDHLTHG
jgi:hypothetical protein